MIDLEDIPVPTGRQIARSDRSLSILRSRQTPTYPGPLYVEDDNDSDLRLASDVASRVLALMVVTMRVSGLTREQAAVLLAHVGAEISLTPAEASFLRAPDIEPRQTVGFLWRVEAMLLLLWALGEIDEFSEWPMPLSDPHVLLERLKRIQRDPDGFVHEAILRPTAEILDLQDLTLRLHWAIHEARVNQRLIPDDLDWSGGAERVPVHQSASVAVVQERHRALTWLTQFLDGEWHE